MKLWQTGMDSALAPLTGDFRRTLQTHIDAIALRDIDLYGLILGPDDTPCVQQGDGPPIIGREAVLSAVRASFADSSRTYHPTILWTFEEERTAIAMLEVTITSNGTREATSPSRRLQLLVFQRPRDGWRLVLDHRV